MKRAGFVFPCPNVDTLKVREVSALSGFPDGHPYENEGKVVIDTYPDIFRNQRLYILINTG